MAHYRVLLGRRASAQLRALFSRPRGMLAQELVLISRHGPPSGLLAAFAGGAVAACEVLAERRLLLVYAVLEHTEAFRSLVGADLDREHRRRAIRRVMHGRR